MSPGCTGSDNYIYAFTLSKISPLRNYIFLQFGRVGCWNWSKLHRIHLLVSELEKTKSMNTVDLNFFYVLRQIFKFFPKFRSLNVQIINNFKYITFIDCKWCNICKYYVNNMVIFCSTCQREETECTWVKYLIYAVWSQFQIFVIYAFFSPNRYFQSLEYFNLVLLFFYLFF